MKTLKYILILLVLFGCYRVTENMGLSDSGSTDRDARSEKSWVHSTDDEVPPVSTAPFFCTDIDTASDTVIGTDTDTAQLTDAETDRDCDTHSEVASNSDSKGDLAIDTGAANDSESDTESDTESDSESDSESDTGNQSTDSQSTADTEPGTAARDIVLTPGRDESELNFTWYTPVGDDTRIEIAPVVGMVQGQFPVESAMSFSSVVTQAGEYYSNKATAVSLEANTTYVYRLGIGANAWSDAYQVTTRNPASFGFVAVGDPQIGTSSLDADAAAWQSTLETAVSLFPNTAFVLSTGDQVDNGGNEDQFHAFFTPELLRSVPIVPALGNHDAGAYNTDRHFNVPNLSATDGLTKPGWADYRFIYGDVLFIVLNSNQSSAATHEVFISNSVTIHPDAQWIVVLFHHDVYGSSWHTLESSLQDFRAAIFSVLDKYRVDVVINGHDHSYSRSHVLKGDIVQTDISIDETGALVNPDGIVYFTLNSATGSKYYGLNAIQAEYCAFRFQTYLPSFTYVAVDGARLSVQTFQIDASSETPVSLMDSVSIVKNQQ